MKKLMIAVSLVLTTGCTAFTVVDRDFEKEEADYIRKYGVPAASDPLYAAPTGTVIEAANEDGVKVSLARGIDDIHPQTGDRLQSWYGTIYNSNDEPKCVAIQWQLMDFDLIADHSTYIYLKPKETLMDYAKFKQKFWDLDGVTLVLPPSGKIGAILVADPTEKNDCEYADEDIKEDFMDL